MTGAILVTLLAVLCAAGILVAVLLANRPEEGWVGWVRGSYRAWRSDELTWIDDVDEEDAGGLGTLYLMSEPGNAYATAEEVAGPLVEGLSELEDRAYERRERRHGRPTGAST